MTEIEKYIKDFDEGHSEFQIENFMIASQGHLFFQYKQVCRELKTRYPQVKAKGKCKPHVKREFEKLLKIAKEIRTKLRWGELSEREKQIMESHAWMEKAKHMMAIDLIASNGAGVSRQTIEFILQLPMAHRKALIGDLQKAPDKRAKLIEWVLDK